MIFGKFVNKYYLKYWLFLLIGLIALIAVDFYQLEIPNICGQIIDGVQGLIEGDIDHLSITINNPLNAPLEAICGIFISDKSDALFEISKAMFYLGIIAVIMFVGRFGWRYCVFGTGAKIESDLREDMFIHAEKLSNQYYKEHKTGALMALFTNDLQTIKNSLSQGIMMTVDAIFLGSFAFYRMVNCNWVLALICLIPCALIAVISSFVGKIMKKKFLLRQEAYDDLSDFAQENFSGIAVIKAFVKEVNEIRHFDKINQNNLEKNVDFVRFSTLLDVLLTFFISTVIAILIGGGTFFVINGLPNGQEFTSGNLFEFIAYFDTIVWPFMAIAQLINMRAQAKASYNRIANLLEEKVDIIDENVINKDQILGKIEFKGLTFNYPDGSNSVLSDISFTIPAGKMVGIIGKTGCGKTTIVDLLLRTYNIKENSILIDDVDIMRLPFKKVRDSIGYVPQDNFLFSDTIRNNIGFAYDEVDQTEIETAACLADVHQNIEEFEHKYDTILGERGVTLSGGQKQRVSIARALMKNPPILIFDDSVSAVDTKTEEKILTNLRNLRKGKTTIMIAHRISTVETLDMIIVMDDGKISGIGTHDELIKSNKLYQEMVHLQSLEKKVNGGEA